MYPEPPEFVREIRRINYDGTILEPIRAVSPQQAMERLERFMHIHGLNDWSYGWIQPESWARQYLGITIKSMRRIELSSMHLPFVDDWALADTIKHEIAHALNFNDSQEEAHGVAWQLIAERIGALPTETAAYRKELSNA